MTTSETKDFPSHEELLTWCIYSLLVEFRNANPKSIRKIAKTRVELLRELSSPIRERFVYWWKTKKVIDDLEIKGYTLGQMVNEQPDQIPCAFIYFNGLYKNPNNYFDLKYCHQTYGRPMFSNSNKSNLIQL